MSSSIENIYEFYKNQPVQLSNLNSIKEWFIQAEVVKNIIPIKPSDTIKPKSKTKAKAKPKPKERPNVLLVIGNTGIGKCVSREANVLTINNIYKPIKLIEPGEYILDPLGNSRLVHKVCHGISDRYYNIKYHNSTSSFSYKVTRNHLLVLKDLCNIIKYCYPYEVLGSSMYLGMDISGNRYTVEIEEVLERFEYVGISVEGELFVIDNGIITHNSDIISNFLKSCTYDILDMGKLLDIYESTNIYSIKDFIPKILKQKNVSDIKNKKLLVIDSLEEHVVVQKTILRDVVENLEILEMPVVIVSESNSFDNLEKKVIAKLKKDCKIVQLEKPTKETLERYIQNYLGDVEYVHNEIIDKMIYSCNGDLRYLTNMLYFYKLETNGGIYSQQQRDIIMDTECSLLDFSDGNLDEIYNRCEMDPFIFGMLTYENYINCKNKPGYSKKNIISSICYADYLEKKLFKYQQWDLLEGYSFCSTIYPWKQLETPKTIQSSCTLQKYMNTKKKNRKYTLDF
jgi:DNA polymerase III delta prime subunit